MPVISLKGIRGGVGTTTISSALAWELNKSGEKVIIIDLSPDNLLRLHFNSEFASSSGWASAIYENESWETTAWEYKDDLLFIPFGKLNKKEKETILTSENIFSFWANNINKIKNQSDYDWIIIDMPAESYSPYTLIEQQISDINISVAIPEANCHSRIYQQLEYNEFILANKLDVRSELQNDIYQFWLHSLPNLLPLVIHHDEAIMEAAAAKCPIGQYRPESLGTNEMYALAIWCITYAKNKGLK